MIEQTPWIERKFTFNQPIGLLPSTIERLRGVPFRLSAMVAAHSEDILGTRPVGGLWSVKEHIGHLFDLDAVHDGRLDDYLAGLQVLRAADMTNRRTFEGGYNNRNVAEVLGLFAQRRLGFVNRLSDFNAEDAERVAKHPRLGVDMRIADMALFCAEHDEHHMVRVARLLGL